jgi:uncharacterized protein (UPF0333 family)
MRRRRSGGQALVEFSLVIPIFLTLFVAITEFSFMFTSYVSVNYASHDAAQVAATYGNTSGADCAVLERVDNDVTIPANATQINSVDIYWVNTATANANPVSGAENIYTYDGGSHQCMKPDGTKINVPFPIASTLALESTSGGYPESTRCNVNSGINCPATNGIAHNTVDTLGVKILYQYKWVTPLPAMINGSGNGPVFTSINIMRLEPVQ